MPVWMLEEMPGTTWFHYAPLCWAGLHSTLLSHLPPLFPSFALPLFTYSPKLFTSPSSSLCPYCQLLKKLLASGWHLLVTLRELYSYQSTDAKLGLTKSSLGLYCMPVTVVVMPLQLAIPVSRIKQGTTRCSLLYSQQLCLLRVKTCPGFFYFYPLIISDHPICPIIYFPTLEEITIGYGFRYAETKELNAEDFHAEINACIKG